jgi:hypothetical protein
MTTEIRQTHIEELIRQLTPCAHGHQTKAITKFVLAIIDKQMGNSLGACCALNAFKAKLLSIGEMAYARVRSIAPRRVN